MKHFEALQTLVDINFVSLKQNLDSRHVSSSYAMITCIIVDKAIIKGSPHQIHRIFVRTKDSSELVNVGWVLKEGITSCFLCGNDFNDFFSSKYHCHTCGNIVCNDCMSLGQIKGFHSLPLVEICSQCNFDQVNLLF